jgi:hypothetical protein
VAVAVVAVLAVEGLKVELVDGVEDEPGEVALGEPVAQVRGEQEGLVAVAAQKAMSHSLFYLFVVLAPNALVLDIKEVVGRTGRRAPGRHTAHAGKTSKLRRSYYSSPAVPAGSCRWRIGAR